MIVLITGGQRSGKSRYAERMALELSPNPVYIATAHVGDEEMAERVRRHQQRRGERWTNYEEERRISRFDIEGRVAVVDCLTLWCSNFMYDGEREATVDDALSAAKEEFDRMARKDATLIFVTNEIGSGGVSPNAVQRRFTDLQGWMNQYVAERADKVILMVCGIPVRIK